MFRKGINTLYEVKVGGKERDGAMAEENASLNQTEIWKIKQQIELAKITLKRTKQGSCPQQEKKNLNLP